MAEPTNGWEWVGPTVQILAVAVAIATLIWSRLPDYSLIRRVERLAAIVKDLDTGSPARVELQVLLDHQASALAERLAPKQRLGRTRRRLRTSAAFAAVTALASVVVGLLVSLATGSTDPQGVGPSFLGLFLATIVGAVSALISVLREWRREARDSLDSKSKPA